MLAIPLDASSWPAGVLVALGAAALAWLAWVSLVPRLRPADSDRHLLWRPTWDDAKEFVAGLRR